MKSAQRSNDGARAWAKRKGSPGSSLLSESLVRFLRAFNRETGCLRRKGAMHSEYVEQRNGGYYVAGTRISLDSVVYAFNRGDSPERI